MYESVTYLARIGVPFDLVDLSCSMEAKMLQHTYYRFHWEIMCLRIVDPHLEYNYANSYPPHAHWDLERFHSYNACVYLSYSSLNFCFAVLAAFGTVEDLVSIVLAHLHLPTTYAPGRCLPFRPHQASVDYLHCYVWISC